MSTIAKLLRSKITTLEYNLGMKCLILALQWVLQSALHCTATHTATVRNELYSSPGAELLS